MTPSKIQGLFKTLPTLETLTDQATKIYLHFFLDSEAATREHASYVRILNYQFKTSEHKNLETFVE